ncbi:unnamed protein product [Camellia sinensis]
MFNSALTARLLNPMSSPLPPSDKARSSPTLFEMMASEPDSIPRSQQRLSEILGSRSPGSQFNDPNSSERCHQSTWIEAAIGFDAGVLSCLEYVEDAPWAEDEEEKVASVCS